MSEPNIMTLFAAGQNYGKLASQNKTFLGDKTRCKRVMRRGVKRIIHETYVKWVRCVECKSFQFYS